MENQEDLINDKEFNQFIEDCYSKVTYCRPTKKEVIEEFLRWRKDKEKAHLSTG